MTDRLFVFTVTAKGELRHTHLTRAQGEATDLPPLTDWLGAEIDTDAIELFPVTDLGDMTLSEYIRLAFAPEPVSPRDARRIDAIKGTVLLVPERALSEEPAPAAEARLIATLPLLQADHSARLPKADVTTPRPVTPPAPPTARQGSLIWTLIALVAIAALVWLLVA